MSRYFDRLVIFSVAACAVATALLLSRSALDVYRANMVGERDGLTVVRAGLAAIRVHFGQDVACGPGVVSVDGVVEADGRGGRCEVLLVIPHANSIEMRAFAAALAPYPWISSQHTRLESSVRLSLPATQEGWVRWSVAVDLIRPA